MVDKYRWVLFLIHKTLGFHPPQEQIGHDLARRIETLEVHPGDRGDAMRKAGDFWQLSSRINPKEMGLIFTINFKWDYPRVN